MGNALTIYLNKRLKNEQTYGKIPLVPGPVITISREVGCNGLKLAGKIVNKLNQQNFISEWKVLSKEIFQQSANELGLEPEKIRQIFKQTDRYVFDEIIKAFNSRNFKSERKIVKSVIDIVRTFAVDGYCIIVGRAGHIIAKDIENAFHIRLFAPLEYRVQTIMENRELDREGALIFIEKVEKERIAFRKAIRAEHLHDNDYFDIHLNRASFTDDEILEIICLAVQKKGILKDCKFKMEYY